MDIVIQPLKRTIVLQADNPRQDITLINQSRQIVAEQKPPAVIEHKIERKEIVFATPNMRGPKGEDGQGLMILMVTHWRFIY